MARVRNPTVRGVLPGGKGRARARDGRERGRLSLRFLLSLCSSGVRYTRVAGLSRNREGKKGVMELALSDVSAMQGTSDLVQFERAAKAGWKARAVRSVRYYKGRWT